MLTQFLKVIFCYGLALFLGLNLSLPVEAKTLPPIKRMSIVISTDSTHPQANQTMVIRDTQGRPAYELSLVAVSLDNRTTNSIHIMLSTVGRYAPDAEEKYESNLLNPDYWGHGDISIRPEELCAANRNNSLFEARREYVLRRMKIVAQISDIELDDEGIVKMQMTVTVKPNASQRSRPKDIALGEMRKCEDLPFDAKNVEPIIRHEDRTVTWLSTHLFTFCLERTTSLYSILDISHFCL